MNTHVLIDSVVRQVTVLIAQLSTSGGIRAPLAHIANQVFLELSRELEAQGISRKISADMFGMALRAYVRKVARLREGESSPGATLWQAVLDFIGERQPVSRSVLERRFAHDEASVLSSVLRDLCETGLVFSAGSGRQTLYRRANTEELEQQAGISFSESNEDLAWALIHHEGPLTPEELARHFGGNSQELAATIESLVNSGRAAYVESGRLQATDLIISLGASKGWEAAVFDHLQAVVQTICQRLRDGAPREEVGGSTYAFDIWDGHPLAMEVRSQLSLVRAQLGVLRTRVTQYNESVGLPNQGERVLVYVGQSGLPFDVEQHDRDPTCESHNRSEHEEQDEEQ